MTEQDYQILLSAIIILIGLYLAFFKSYFKEKGKNLATLDDIGAITTIVENVKKENNTQLELMKKDLQLLSKSQIANYDDERKAIIEFMGEINTFYSSCIDVPIVSADPEGLAILLEKRSKNDSEFSKVQIKASNLSLFCENKEISNAVHPVMVKLTEIKGKTSIAITKAMAQARLQKHRSDIHLGNPSAENFKLFEQELEKGVKQHQEFLDLKLEHYKDYLTAYTPLHNLCKQYLKAKQV